MKSETTATNKIHYGWVIVFTGTLIIVACLGLARFAFGMLLPSMRDALSMSYDQMGLLGTMNFAGYLAAVGLVPFLLKRYTPRQIISFGMIMLTICILSISASGSYLNTLILYTIAGAGSGFANIPIMVLVPYWFRRDKRGQAAGFIVIGSGFAIIFSGYLIPFLNSHYGSSGWRISWLIIGIIIAFITLLAIVLIRNTPEEKGLEAYGKAEHIEYDISEKKGKLSTMQILGRLAILYFIFGATYVVYGTFIVTTMVTEYGFSEASAGHFWSWVGFFSIFSGTLFGTLSDKAGRKIGLIAVYFVHTIAYVIAGSGLGSQLVFVSVSLYGVAAFAIPAIMAAAVGDYLGKARAAAGFSFITFCFAIGQTMGPVVAGMIAESTGSFKGAYLLCGGLTFAAILVSSFLPKPE